MMSPSSTEPKPSNDTHQSPNLPSVPAPSPAPTSSPSPAPGPFAPGFNPLFAPSKHSPQSKKNARCFVGTLMFASVGPFVSVTSQNKLKKVCRSRTQVYGVIMKIDPDPFAWEEWTVQKESDY